MSAPTALEYNLESPLDVMAQDPKYPEAKIISEAKDFNEVVPNALDFDNEDKIFEFSHGIKSKKIPLAEDFEQVNEIPTADQIEFKDNIKKQQRIEIAANDVIHHLGLNPSQVEKLNPSLRSHLVTEVYKAVKEDARKRAGGQTEFPVSFDYQNQMRKRVGLSPMKSIMNQYLKPADSSETFSNHEMFPTVYSMASSPTFGNYQDVIKLQQERREYLIDHFKNEATSVILPNEFGGVGTFATKEMTTEELQKYAEKQTDQQLAFEEQMALDAKSKTAKYAKAGTELLANVLGEQFGFNAVGINPRNVAGSFGRTVVGGSLVQAGNLTGVADLWQGDNSLTRLGREVQAGAQDVLNEELVTNKPTTGPEELKRGFELGLGASPELVKLFGGAALLEAAELPVALNLPLQGAISGIEGGPEGIVKGATVGIVYHYGGGFLGPYLGRVGNSLIWIAGPAAEKSILEGQNLAEAIGESLPTGLFVGLTGGERGRVTDGENIRSATLLDIPRVASGELKFVPPSFRVANSNSDFSTEDPALPRQRTLQNVKKVSVINEQGLKINISAEDAVSRINELKTQLENEIPEDKVNGVVDEISRLQDAMTGASRAEAISNISNYNADAVAKRLEELDLKPKFIGNGNWSIAKPLADNSDLRVGEIVNTNELINRGYLDPILEEQNLLAAKIGNSGLYNRMTSRDGYNKVLNNFLKVGGTYQEAYTGAIRWTAKAAGDLAYMMAFHVEDFYHRRIVPSFDLVVNRLKNQLGDDFSKISSENLYKAYNEGVNYYNSNNADPFFSKLKQDAVEKLPNRMTAQQALDVLQGHKTEFEWTVGLEQFLNDKKVEKFSKQELVDIIQRGQVRVEASVADDNVLANIQQQKRGIQQEQNLLRQELRQIVGGNFVTPLEISDPLRYHQLLERQETLSQQESNLNSQLEDASPTKYSLKAYTGEKLELPGAVNSKEVKLISPIPTGKIEVFDPKTGEIIARVDTVEEAKKLTSDNNDYLDYSGEQMKYQAPHWDEANVVAHYRSNDRITTDGKRAYHSEEFQSDWNHDIREKGINKPFPKGMNFKVFDPRLPNNEIDPNEKFFVTVNEAKAYAEANDLDYTSKGIMGEGVEPNPFMAHNWKELILKRFIRDAVVAKDENGNYKYDGVSWTTARQQLIRNNGLMEGKSFKWRSNSDGTYTFEFLRSQNEMGTANDENYWERPHELANISLERFAELVNKEAADEVREKQKEYKPFDQLDRPNGRFSLKEVVELRGRDATYNDYDVALVNMARKIGKRFNDQRTGGYSLKEITIPVSKYDPDGRSSLYVGTGESHGREDGYYVFRTARASMDNKFHEVGNGLRFNTPDEATDFIDKADSKNVKVHYLEITPSMRESLSKEGFSLYGLGGSDTLKSQELGVRNKITSIDGLDQHRENLVNAIIQENQSNPDNVFNSGLDPDALIDRVKLGFSNIKDFSSFVTELVRSYGEGIKPYAQDLWFQLKNSYTQTTKALDEFMSKGRLTGENKEGGFFLLRKAKSQAEKDYKESKKKTPYFDNYSIQRGITLAQNDPVYGEHIYEPLRLGQRGKAKIEYLSLQNLREGLKIAKANSTENLKEVMFIGNQFGTSGTVGKYYTDVELAAGDPAQNRPALNAEEIDAYKTIYKAQHLNLDVARDIALYSMQEKVNNLNTRLATAIPGTPEWIAIQTSLAGLAKQMNGVRKHFRELKEQGYFSLQRPTNAPIAAITIDPTIPLLLNGEVDPQAKQFNRFETLAEAGDFIAEHEAKGYTGSKIYDIRKLENIREISGSLTPAQFEDLVSTTKGVNPADPVIESLRNEIYARYPSQAYKLQRDYTPGYDRTLEFILSSIAHQTETYANSYYSRVAGNEAIKGLTNSNLATDKPDLYNIAANYIKDEISSKPLDTWGKIASSARRGTNFIMLGYQFRQFYQNAIFQPIVQTFPYFMRAEFGVKTYREGVKYFTRAGDIVKELALDKLGAKKLGTTATSFRPIYDQLVTEGVLQAEYAKSLLDLEMSQGASSQLANTLKSPIRKVFSMRQQEHWGSVFMRAGEKVTRTHAAAEAFLVGTEKLNLTGDTLKSFITRAVDATQSNPTKGEMPSAIRGQDNRGHIRKSMYQFNTFNHMWMENVALNIRSDYRAKGINLLKWKATPSALAPVLLLGGLRGAPLGGAAWLLYSLISGRDPKKDADKILGKDSMLERIVLYGVSGNPSLGNQFAPSVPILDNIRIGTSVAGTIADTASATRLIPAVATGGQLARGLNSFIYGDNKEERVKGLINLIPLSAARGPLNAVSLYKFGEHNKENTETIISRGRVTKTDLVLQSIGITPRKTSEYYDEQATDRAIQLRKNVIKIKKRLRHVF